MHRYNPPDTCAGIRFDDGFCSPGELDSQPGDEWLRGCRAAAALAVGQDLGHFTAGDLAEEVPGCGESALRKILKQMKEARMVQSWEERRGIDKTGRRIYELDAPGMDLRDWVKYRQDGGMEAWEGEDVEFDPSSFGAPEEADLYDWSARDPHDLVSEVTYELIPSSQPEWEPSRILARHPAELYPVGIAEVFHSGGAVWDERAFGGLGPQQYAPLGCIRVHPGYRRMGIATALVQQAASLASDLGVPLASSDSRTPGMAKFWAKQVKAKTATKKRHRSKKHPEGARYVMGHPPRTLANPAQASLPCPACGEPANWSQVEATPSGTVVVYTCPSGHRFTAQEPAHPPEFFQPNPYQEWWRQLAPGVEGEAAPDARTNPCWPCLLL